MGQSRFSQALLVLIAGRLSSDLFVRKSGGEHLKPNDRAGARLGQ
jgi:hypothetical protein